MSWRGKRRGILSVAVLAVMGAVPILLSSSAGAVNRYTIQPSSPKPVVCDNHGLIAAGTWLQNKPCGYFIGTAMSGSSFDVHETTANGYHYGRVHGNNNLCAWIPPKALGKSPTGTAPESCSDATREKISHRRTFGYDFNAAKHDETDGTPISVNTNCRAFYNYYTSSAYNTGTLRNRAGTPSAQVRYRFTTNGSNPAIVVRDTKLGWVFLDRDCVTDWRTVTFHNGND